MPLNLYRPPPPEFRPTILHSIGAPLFSGPIPETPASPPPRCPTPPEIRQALLLLERAVAESDGPEVWWPMQTLRWLNGLPSPLAPLLEALADHLPKLPP